ncbi:MAG: hypothetical protein CL678_04025 [Bdellovibrionaceae bacterium]|nr:hypothetical protein [Pseudobdellovibrionaceae bacterium]|tara:strand:+ start:292 stop:669 length:378 start_codon:yes stop_codon:yes gene_type:complete
MDDDASGRYDRYIRHLFLRDLSEFAAARLQRGDVRQLIADLTRWCAAELASPGPLPPLRNGFLTDLSAELRQLQTADAVASSQGFPWTHELLQRIAPTQNAPTSARGAAPSDFAPRTQTESSTAQ